MYVDPEKLFLIDLPLYGRRKRHAGSLSPDRPRGDQLLSRGVRKPLPRIWHLWLTKADITIRNVKRSTMALSCCSANQKEQSTCCLKRNSPLKVRAGTGPCLLSARCWNIHWFKRLLFSLVHLSMLVTQAAAVICSPSLKVIPNRCKFFILHFSYYMTGPRPTSSWVVHQGRMNSMI